jgi:MoxR-like ATPase
MADHVEIEGVRLFLGKPDRSPGEWIGQPEILKQLLACWLVVDPSDLPLAPRLVGTPGIGKTTLGMAGARARKQDLYIYQCTAAGRSAGHPRPRRERQDRLSRLAARHRHDPRRHLPA